MPFPSFYHNSFFSETLSLRDHYLTKFMDTRFHEDEDCSVCVTVCSYDGHSLLHSFMTHYIKGTYQYALTKSRVSIGRDTISRKNAKLPVRHNIYCLPGVQTTCFGL